jgi:Protein of unknown function (DUF3303)
MLFQVSYKAKALGSEAMDKRVMQVFGKWRPPAGMEVKAHYARPDGSGFLIVEANSVAPLVESNTVYMTWMDVEVTPIVDVSEAVPAIERALAFRDTVR